jgi:hypothetical protein
VVKIFFTEMSTNQVDRCIINYSRCCPVAEFKLGAIDGKGQLLVAVEWGDEALVWNSIESSDCKAWRTPTNPSIVEEMRQVLRELFFLPQLQGAAFRAVDLIDSQITAFRARNTVCGVVPRLAKSSLLLPFL